MDPRGAPPLHRLLRRAVFEDVDSFFVAGPGGGEPFPEFAKRRSNAEQRPGNKVALQLLWLGSGQNQLLRPTEGFLKALFAPSVVEVAIPQTSSPLGRALRVLLGPSTGAAAVPPSCSGRALLDLLQRHKSSGGLVTAAATDGVVTDERGSPVGLLTDGDVCVCSVDPGMPLHEALRCLAAKLLAVLGLSSCHFYACCLMCPREPGFCGDGAPDLHLCPVCLRKLGTLLGGSWDAGVHYRELVAWANHEDGFDEEARWYRERFQVVTESYAEEANDRPQRADCKQLAKRSSQTETPHASAGYTEEANDRPHRANCKQLAKTSSQAGTSHAPPAVASTERGHVSRSGPARNSSAKSELVDSADLEAALRNGAAVEVMLAGRRGALSALNGTYLQCDTKCNGRAAFHTEADAVGSPRLFLYYLASTDSWAVGPTLGGEAVYADCGPSRGRSLTQVWRIWDGHTWADDPSLKASVVRASER
eukprot:gnl/TRDRNA2_/TRDRNA2_156686_c0_seq2.p1 gnl/TRDRNA2_/TRDRNA2_156686_c0~~gnl/TRDRNA2_/TRDRNA2_156686_c0_seq2.p1  ORF type:complete len:478 (+),score=79.72 gnl/TRDRNA2_/TRDRNA2_156686_c0_seq2:23-1456(+)